MEFLRADQGSMLRQRGPAPVSKCSAAIDPVFALCLHDLLTERARRSPDAIALLSEDGQSLTFAELLDEVNRVSSRLGDFGIHPGQRMATCLGGGASTMILMLAIACRATYAPLNPRCHPTEAERSLRQTKAVAVIVVKGTRCPGRSGAEALGLPIIEIEIDPTNGCHGGTLQLLTGAIGPPSSAVAAPDDAFFLLQTSGTTALPKLVPSTHRALMIATEQTIPVLRLTADDCCLHMLSTVHVAGITTILYSIMAGSQVACMPTFAAQHFFSQMRRFRPTWFTAAPAIHQSILLQAPNHPDVLDTHRLRFVRSASAPMPMPLRNEIERTWEVPLVEAYAMSECPMLTSNHTPPGPSKPGSVGRSMGTEIGLLDDAGNLLDPQIETIGEIAVRGPAVMTGYDDNPEANANAFVNGWFRTGDLGWLDADGFLFVTGRIKEQINRGGVKIAPFEIDEAALAHPAVADALAFSIPDARLGEEIGLAVVLHAGAAATELELKLFLASKLSDYKVPRRIVFIAEIPKGSTGKAQRIGLADKLGLKLEAGVQTGNTPCVAATTPTEEKLQSIWAATLGAQKVISITDNFADLGGDSLQAVAMLAEIERVWGTVVPIAILLTAPTIQGLARIIDDRAADQADGRLVAIRPQGTRPPLICLPGMHGSTYSFFQIAKHLGDDQPVYGIELPKANENDPATRDIVALASRFIDEICKLQPQGPYQLAGYSFGGYLAYEMAQQLHARGKNVSLLLMFDTRAPGYPIPRSKMSLLFHRVLKFACSPRMPRVAGRLHASARTQPSPQRTPQQISALPVEKQGHVERASKNAVQRYVIQKYPGTIHFFRATIQPKWYAFCVPDASMGWRRWAKRVEVQTVAGDHEHMLKGSHPGPLAELIKPLLSR